MDLCYDMHFQNEIDRAPFHIYIAPHPLLQPFIAHYTITHPNFTVGEFETLTLVPDASGCLIFSLDHSFEGLVIGATTRTMVVQNDFNTAPLRLFVEFLPGGLARLAQVCQTGLTDLRVDMESVHKRLFVQIRQAFEEARDLDGFVQRVDRILLGLVPPNLPGLLPYALGQMKSTAGGLTVAELSRITCYSERHLNRVFNEQVGMGVKKYARLLRVNEVIRRMGDRQAVLTNLAQDGGYYDQSHFIRDFKEICGTTPRQYLLHMSDFYNETLKF